MVWAELAPEKMDFLERVYAKAEIIRIVSGAVTFAMVVAQVTKSITAINDCCSQFTET